MAENARSTETARARRERPKVMIVFGGGGFYFESASLVLGLPKTWDYVFVAVHRLKPALVQSHPVELVEPLTTMNNRSVFAIATTFGHLIVRAHRLYRSHCPSVVICLGDLTAYEIEDAYVLAAGTITVKTDTKRSVVYSRGPFRGTRRVYDSTVHAAGGARVGSSRSNVYVNTAPTRSSLGGGDRNVSKAAIVDR